MASRNEQSENYSGYAFIANPLELPEVVPFEITSGHFIQRASDDQTTQIREELTRINPYFGIPIIHALYEAEYLETKTARGIEGRFRNLPPQRWRYNVIAFSPTNSLLNEIEEASNLTEVPIEVPFFFLNIGGRGGHAGRIASFFSEISPSTKPIKVSHSELVDIQKAFSETREVESDYPELKRATRMLDSLKMLPTHSEFRVLGLFSIVEMLITHNPKLDDRGDSITHQMKSKVPLLSRRFSRPLNYSSHFGECSDDDVWECLYAYRSAIAHGGSPDFKKKHKLLRDAGTALAFLKEAVRALVRHGLKEPQLYRDLREC